MQPRLREANCLSYTEILPCWPKVKRACLHCTASHSCMTCRLSRTACGLSSCYHRLGSDLQRHQVSLSCASDQWKKTIIPTIAPSSTPVWNNCQRVICCALVHATACQSLQRVLVWRTPAPHQETHAQVRSTPSAHMRLLCLACPCSLALFDADSCLMKNEATGYITMDAATAPPRIGTHWIGMLVSLNGINDAP